MHNITNEWSVLHNEYVYTRTVHNFTKKILVQFRRFLLSKVKYNIILTSPGLDVPKRDNIFD